MDTLTVRTEHDYPRSPGRRDLACRHLEGVSSLFAARGDLRGVHAFADVMEELVLWSA